MRISKKKEYLLLGLWEKFVFLFIFLILAITKTKEHTPIYIASVLFFYLFIVQKATIKSVLYFLRIPLFFALFGLLSIVIVLGISEDAVWKLSLPYISLSITNESLLHTQTVAYRVFNSLLVFYGLVTSFNRDEYLHICKKLHIPSDLIELGVLSFRYVHILMNKAKEIHIAQQLRLGYVSYRISLSSFSLLLSSVFIYSTIFFRKNYQALLCRGYNKQLFYPIQITAQPHRWWLIGSFFIVGFLGLFYL